MIEKTVLGVGVSALTVAAMLSLWGLDRVTYGLASPALIGVGVYALLMLLVTEALAACRQARRDSRPGSSDTFRVIEDSDE